MWRVGIRLATAAVLFSVSAILAQTTLDAFDPGIALRHPWVPSMPYVAVFGLLATILSCFPVALCIGAAEERRMRLVGILPTLLLVCALLVALAATAGAGLYAVDLAGLGPVA